jgi:tetratricopeptide (TPR) repeat protein
MKKTITVFTLFISTIAFSQSIQVQNMVNYLRNKDLVNAKVSADAAAVNESTKSTAKMWLYRGDVYRAIYSDTSARVRKIDSEAEEKALEAYINCMKNDKDLIYKDQVKGILIGSTAAVSNKANYYARNKEYDKALTCYDLLEASLPYDFDGGIKRNNISREKLLYYKFDMYQYAGNKEKTKEFADKLIAIKYKDPKIYTGMVALSLNNNDTAAALSYIEQGKSMFEDNTELITTELAIYIKRDQTNILRDRLIKAIEVSPDNETLHFVLANIYQGTNQIVDAEKEYLKAIELKSDYVSAIYNIGVLYYNEGKEWNTKLNALPLKDPKTKEYETKSNENFKKAVGYLETSFELTKDPQTKKILRPLCLRLGETEKAEKYK